MCQCQPELGHNPSTFPIENVKLGKPAVPFEELGGVHLSHGSETSGKELVQHSVTLTAGQSTGLQVGGRTVASWPPERQDTDS